MSEKQWYRAVLVMSWLGMVFSVIALIITFTHDNRPAPVKKPDPRALYVKAAPLAAQLPGFVCQNEVNNEMPSGWEPICYPLVTS